MSHFEFEHDFIDDNGNIVSKTLKGVGKWQPLTEVFGQFQVLRFMNWQKTNVSEWLAPPPYSTEEMLKREKREAWRAPIYHNPFDTGSLDWKGSLGVPLHVCLEFAKNMNANPWICIPHGGDNWQFTSMMRIMVDTTFAALEGTGLTPIFEFSNEVWNRGFRQHQECANLHRSKPIDTAFAPEEYQAQVDHALTWQVLRTNQIAEYVKERGYVVLSAQANNPLVAKQLLGMKISEYVDALGVAPYFGRFRPAQWAPKDILPNGFHALMNLATDEKIDITAADASEKLYQNVLAYIKGNAEGLGGETRKVLLEHRVLLDEFNSTRSNPLKFWAYEGGGDISCAHNDAAYSSFDIPAVQEFFMAFNRSQKMGNLVKALLDLWFSDEIGGDLFCGYSAATVYKQMGKHSGRLNYDFFGHIELGGEDFKAYEATWKLYALLERIAG